MKWMTRERAKVDQHMTIEVPRVIFLHYGGLGATRTLAQGLKAALDTQHK